MCMSVKKPVVKEMLTGAKGKVITEVINWIHTLSELKDNGNANITSSYIFNSISFIQHQNICAQGAFYCKIKQKYYHIYCDSTAVGDKVS